MVQLSCAIGKAEPVSFLLDFRGTGILPEKEVEQKFPTIFDLTPGGIKNY